MQINRVSSSDNTEKWAPVAAQPNTASSSVDTAMAAESDIAIKGVTDSKTNDNLKTSADKSQDLKSKDNHDNKDNKDNTDNADNTQLKFKVHKGTGEIMIQVIDNDTGKVVREIPPENLLDIIASIWKTAGINVDKKI